MKKAIVIEVGLIRILVVVLQLLFLKIFTKHTSIYELGIYYFLFTISYSLNAFILVPLDYFQQSNLYNLKLGGISLRSFTKINAWVVMITFIFMFLISILFYFIKPSFAEILPIIICLALSTYLVNLLRGFINNLEKRRLAIYTFLLEIILKIVFYLIYISYFESSALIILYATLSSSLLTFISLFFFIKKMDEYKNKAIRHFKISEIINFSYPISIGAVVNWIQLQGYRMILVPLGLVEIVGVYGTVANVGTAGMSAFSTIYSQLFVPNLYKTNGEYITKYLKFGLFAIAAILIISFFLSDFIVGILTKDDLVQYSSLILFGVASEAGNFIIGSLTIYLTIKNITKSTMKASFLGLSAFLLSFGIIYLFNLTNLYTIGIPIVFTQIVIAVYLSIIVFTSKELVV